MSFQSTLRIAALAGVLAAGSSFADEPASDPGKLRRLESVTWNPVTHELTWVVSEGDKPSEGEYKAGEKKMTYHIRMDAATMDVQGEARRFSPLEARTVHSLMDYISRYAVESTVWWEDGQGEKVDESGKKIPDETPAARPPVNKIEAPSAPPAPQGPSQAAPPPRARVMIAKSLQR